MHLLQRGAAPACLGNYQHGLNSWDHQCPTQAERLEIHIALENMQTRRCAYCECDLDTHGQHIEHFRQRSRYPQGTFEWNNLFWSCLCEDSCGKHKDKCGAYDHLDLIKPDLEDPAHFFFFASNGTIAIRTDTLTPNEQHRAKETLRIFNLDDERGALRKLRAIAASGYLKAAEEILELAAEFSPVELQAYIDSEYGYARDLPFCTTIMQVLSAA